MLKLSKYTNYSNNIYSLKLIFYSFIAFLTHENIGLDPKSESLSSLVFALQYIYWFCVMANCIAAILDFKKSIL